MRDFITKWKRLLRCWLLGDECVADEVQNDQEHERNIHYLADRDSHRRGLIYSPKWECEILSLVRERATQFEPSTLMEIVLNISRLSPIILQIAILLVCRFPIATECAIENRKVHEMIKLSKRRRFSSLVQIFENKFSNRSPLFVTHKFQPSLREFQTQHHLFLFTDNRKVKKSEEKKNFKHIQEYCDAHTAGDCVHCLLAGGRKRNRIVDDFQFD